MYPLIAGVLMSEGEMRRELLSALRNLPIRVFFQQPESLHWPDFLDLVSRQRTDVVFLDLNLPEPFERAAEMLRTVAPRPAIVAVHNAADAETILSVMRAGADDFLVSPVSGGIQKALERVVQLRAKSNGEEVHVGKLVGIMSGKGGAGATTLACHLAVAISRTAAGASVLLADLHLTSGLVGFLMKAQTSYSLLDAMVNLHRLDGSYWKGLVSSYKGEVDVIPAPATTPSVEALDLERLLRVIRFVRGAYDWVILDLGNHLSPIAKSLLGELDELLVVATLDCAGLYQSRRTINALLDNGCKRRGLRLILNRTHSDELMGSQEVERLLGLTPYADLPWFAGIEEAYADGKLVNGDSKFGRRVAYLAQKMAGSQQEANVRRSPVFGFKSMLKLNPLASRR